MAIGEKTHWVLGLLYLPLKKQRPRPNSDEKVFVNAVFNLVFVRKSDFNRCHFNRSQFQPIAHSTVGSFLLIPPPPHQFNSPPVKRPREIIIELIVTTNRIAVFYSSNCN